METEMKWLIAFRRRYLRNSLLPPYYMCLLVFLTCVYCCGRPSGVWTEETWQKCTLIFVKMVWDLVVAHFYVQCKSSIVISLRYTSRYFPCIYHQGWIVWMSFSNFFSIMNCFSCFCTKYYTGKKSLRSALYVSSIMLRDPQSDCFCGC